MIHSVARKSLILFYLLKVRSSAYEPRGQGFESLPAHQKKQRLRLSSDSLFLFPLLILRNGPHNGPHSSPGCAHRPTRHASSRCSRNYYRNRPFYELRFRLAAVFQSQLIFPKITIAGSALIAASVSLGPSISHDRPFAFPDRSGHGACKKEPQAPRLRCTVPALTKRRRQNPPSACLSCYVGLTPFPPPLHHCGLHGSAQPHGCAIKPLRFAGG